MSTLGEMKRAGERVILFCQSYVGVRWCGHQQKPRMDQLIQYFGVDYDLIANRAGFLAKFVCEQCGGKTATMQVLPPERGAFNGGLWDPAEQKLSKVETTRSDLAAALAKDELERLAELTAYQQQIANARRAAAKERDRIDTLAERGIFVIGPPNPWKGRKAPRPNMKIDKGG